MRFSSAALSRTSFLVALAAGGLTVFAFAPFHFWPLQILALGVLFLLVLRTPSVRAAMQLGWAFGFASVAAGTYWLYISMHDVGGLPALLAVAAVGLLAALLGLFYALAAGAAMRLTARTKNTTMTLLCALPACWMLADWTRGWLFTGFSWVVTGYAHNASPLSGFAPLVGVYGVGWLAALLAGCVALLVQQRAPHKGALALLILIPVAGLALQTIRWTAPLGQPLSVRLLQGNVPQDLKFDRDQILFSLALYQDMIMQAPADLIATPETALPVLTTQLPAGYLDNLSRFGKDSGSTILLGVPWTTAPGVYLNSVLGMSDGSATYRYDKHHLVPFGEFIPPGARWFVELMQIPLGDFGRGDLLQTPIRIKDQWLLPNICYEDLFGEEIAAQLAAAHSRGSPQASVLLNVSNIAWFGDSIALPQHLQISQMRALETGRPMLRATNTGATAVIDARGNVIASLPAFTRGTLAAKVQGQQGQTPYIVLGNSVPVGLAGLLLLILAWIVRRQTRLAE